MVLFAGTSPHALTLRLLPEANVTSRKSRPCDHARLSVEQMEDRTHPAVLGIGPSLALPPALPVVSALVGSPHPAAPQTTVPVAGQGRPVAVEQSAASADPSVVRVEAASAAPNTALPPGTPAESAFAAPTVVVVVPVPAGQTPPGTPAAAPVFFIEEHTGTNTSPAAPTDAAMNPLTTVVVVFVFVPVPGLFEAPNRAPVVVPVVETHAPVPVHDITADVVAPNHGAQPPRTDSLPIRGSDEFVDGGGPERPAEDKGKDVPAKPGDREVAPAPHPADERIAPPPRPKPPQPPAAPGGIKGNPAEPEAAASEEPAAAPPEEQPEADSNTGLAAAVALVAAGGCRSARRRKAGTVVANDPAIPAGV
jgi:hypothetical protein